jgi:hypothetical protein
LISRPVHGLSPLSLQMGGNRDDSAIVLVLVHVPAALTAARKHSILKSFFVRCTSSASVYLLKAERTNSRCGLIVG